MLPVAKTPAKSTKCKAFLSKSKGILETLWTFCCQSKVLRLFVDIFLTNAPSTMHITFFFGGGRPFHDLRISREM